MNSADILQILHTVGAIITDSHFVYTSGKHGSAYVNKDAVYPYTQEVQKLCAAMAEPFLHQRIDTVAGPTMGGVILTQWIAHTLSAEGRQVAACYAEEKVAPDGRKTRYFGRGYERFIHGKRVLIAEDILNTGGSVKLVVDAVRAAGGEVVAITALCNRGGVQPADIGNAPIHALVDIALEAWDPTECPLCKKGVPINTTVGKGGRN